MTQALFTSMTGLNAGTQQLTVVSDNVANMNTTAYKTSRVDFQDIWYSTKTTGTSSTKNSGGTNPYQIGVGVQCAAITKDFSASSTNTTGRAEDMAITGNGWFTVLDSDGKVLLTRDGSFSLDENGYLCTANGSKVLGMDQNLSLNRSDTPIKIPTSIKVTEGGTPAARFGEMFLTDLNGLGSTHNGITSGKFNIIVNEGGADTTIEVDLGDTTNKTVNDIVDAINAVSGGKYTATVIDGAISFEPQGATTSMKFETIDEKDGGSNFVAATSLASMPLVDGAYTTQLMNISASIGEVDDITSDTTKNYESFSVGKDGLMTVTYEDGSKLSVRSNEDGTTYFSYINSNGIIINDDIQNSGNASLYVDPNVLEKANMQMQLAKVTNDNGLVAVGNNQYEVGVNCGDVLYTAANVNGVGSVISGALESSNVDLAQQFSNMILAQRLVQANSQVFSGANQLLETLVYLGQ